MVLKIASLPSAFSVVKMKIIWTAHTTLGLISKDSTILSKVLRPLKTSFHLFLNLFSKKSMSMEMFHSTKSNTTTSLWLKKTMETV
jgi:hypothetical protein